MIRRRGFTVAAAVLLASLVCAVVPMTGALPRQPVAEAAQAAGSYAIATDGDTITATDLSSGATAFQGTDAQQVIQSAIDALPEEGGEIRVGKGTYVLNRPVQIKTRSGISIVGEGWQSTALQASGDNDMLVLDGAWFCKITDLLLDGANQPLEGTTGRGIYLGQTDPEGNQLNTFTNLFFSGCRVGIADDFDGKDNSCDNYFVNLKIFDSKSCDIRLSVTYQGYWNFEHIEVDHVGVDNDPGQPAVVFQGFHGITLDEFGMLSWANTGLVFEDCSFIWLTRSDFDHGLSAGVSMDNCTYVTVSDSRIASTCMGSPARTDEAGLSFTDCSHLNITNIMAGCTDGVGCSSVALRRCHYGNLSNIISDTNSGSGLYLADTDHVRVSDSYFTHNTRWGVEEAGTSDQNTLSSVEAAGELGGISRSGQSTAIHQSWSNTEWIAGDSGGSAGLPAWAWILICLGLGVVVAAVVYLVMRGRRARESGTP